MGIDKSRESWVESIIIIIHKWVEHVGGACEWSMWVTRTYHQSLLPPVDPLAGRKDVCPFLLVLLMGTQLYLTTVYKHTCNNNHHCCCYFLILLLFFNIVVITVIIIIILMIIIIITIIYFVLLLHVIINIIIIFIIIY